MRYICEHCGAGGASTGPDHQSPPYYNCHVCEGKQCMWPYPIMQKYQELQAQLEATHQELLEIHRITAHVAGVEELSDDDTLTVSRVKQMAMMINDQAARAQPAKGDAVAMGDLRDEEGNLHARSLLVRFDDVESFGEAVKLGQCKFTVFGGEV